MCLVDLPAMANIPQLGYLSVLNAVIRAMEKGMEDDRAVLRHACI